MLRRHFPKPQRSRFLVDLGIDKWAILRWIFKEMEPRCELDITGQE